MSDYVTLLGAEDVRSAAGTMRESASQMERAASAIDFALTTFVRNFDDLVGRMERAVGSQEEVVGTSAFEGWAIIELMGHRRIAGRVSEAEIAGAKLLRVDIPGDGPEDYATQFVGGSSIYCLTPTTEEMARAAARSSRPEPVTRWELPKPTTDAARETCGVEFIGGVCVRPAGHDGVCDGIGF